ncbi:hypothetical protein EAF00_010994 [Botryotinia globosa]|nr:hypothetical protein EAF00_010994 [Botryotinia globosa]
MSMITRPAIAATPSFRDVGMCIARSMPRGSVIAGEEGCEKRIASVDCDRYPPVSKGIGYRE